MDLSRGRCRRPQGAFAAKAGVPGLPPEWREFFPNGLTDAGLTDVWSVYLNGGTQKTSWYLGLIAESGFVEVDPGDTMSSHAGWSEYTGYNEAARVELTGKVVAERLFTHTTPGAFTFGSTASIRGVFVVSNSTKGGSTGILLATALYSAARSVQGGRTLQLTYALDLTGGA
jgi:hypothetical protein